ncbi:hypothetical protein AD006_30055 (plasmid) [Pseudonocardia sp. EC080610-09]|nr:hypothetical protein AD006_30055 [Pseudonocardia sp. EC080610-09]ALL85559.1 hypothetical protein AD017_31195 [Pseudonocardia sp. EC080619-01]
MSTERPISAVGLARLTHRTTFGDLRDGLTGVIADDPLTVRAGARRLEGIDLLGGLLLGGRRAGTFDQYLKPGWYELFDYADITTSARPSRASFTVVAGPGEGIPDTGPDTGPGAVLVAVADPFPHYVIQGALRAGHPIRLINALRDQPSDAVFFELAPHALPDHVEDWARRFEDDEPPPYPPVDLTAGIGGMPLGSGRSSVVTLPLRPGRHLVASLLNDFADGTRMTAKGQFLIVDVHPGEEAMDA